MGKKSAKKQRRLGERVRKTRLDTMQQHVLVCRECDGGKEAAKRMRHRVARRGLRDRVTVSRVECLGICTAEPVCVVYPEGAWYCGVDGKVADRIVDEHLDEGAVLARAAFHVNALRERSAS